MATKAGGIGIAESFRIEEARHRRLTVRLTVIPVAVGLCVILASVWAVKKSQGEVNDAKKQIMLLSSERDKAAADLKQTQNSLTNARLAGEKVRHAINHYQRGEYPAAIDDYRSALSIDPESYIVYDWLGYAYYRNKQYSEAESSLRKSVEINPSYARGFYNLSLALWAVGKRDEAVKAISRAIELDPSLRGAVQQDGQFTPFHQSESFRRLMQ